MSCFYYLGRNKEFIPLTKDDLEFFNNPQKYNSVLNEYMTAVSDLIHVAELAYSSLNLLSNNGSVLISDGTLSIKITTSKEA